MRKLALYIQLSRPFTLLPPLLGIVSGAVCAWGSVHNPDPEPPADALGDPDRRARLALRELPQRRDRTRINQIYDLEIDRRQQAEAAAGHRRAFDRARPGISPDPDLRSWRRADLAGGGLPDTRPGATSSGAARRPRDLLHLLRRRCVSTLVYSMPAFGRTKARGMARQLDDRHSARLPAQGGRLGDGGAHRLHWEPWCIGRHLLLFLVGAASTKDFADIEGDRAGGCKTLPILHGPRKAAWIIAPFFVFPWLLLPLGAYVRDPQNPAHADPHRQSRAARRPGRPAHPLGRLHRLPPAARSGRADPTRRTIPPGATCT